MTRVYSFWESWEIDFLKSHYSTESKERLMKVLNRHTWGAIKKKAHDLGLSRKSFSIRQAKENLVQGRLRRWMERERRFMRDFQENPLWGYVTGAIIGDGWRTYNARKGAYVIGLCSTNKDYLLRFANILKELGVNYYLCSDYSVRFQHKPFFNALKEPLDRLVADKSPEWRLLFLTGLYDTEGSLNRYHLKWKGRTYGPYFRVWIYTSYPRAIDVAESILHQLGIKCTKGVLREAGRVSYYKGKKIVSKRDIPYLSINSQNEVRKFFSIIHPLHPKKRYLHGYSQYLLCPKCFEEEQRRE